MKIELNTPYKCLNGCIFIADQMPEKCVSPIYCYGGCIYNQDGSKNRIAYYTALGMYKTYESSEFDLINPLNHQR